RLQLERAADLRAIWDRVLDRSAPANARCGVAGGRVRRRSRKLECKPAAFADVALDANAAAVLLQNLLAHRQAQTRAASTLARDKYSKDALQILGLNATAVVDDLHAGHLFRVAVLRGDLNAA